VQSGDIKATAVNEPVASIARERGLHPLVDLVAEGTSPGCSAAWW
jgi:hypothetical protein